MICAIMQPTYIPWIGYFNMIDKVDLFVFLDHVKLVKQSWHVRNRVKYMESELMLTMPVSKNSQSNLQINDTSFDFTRGDWMKKHLNTIKHCYAKADHFSDVYPFIEKLYRSDLKNIGDFNINLIMSVSKKIGITTPVVKSGGIGGLEGNKDALVVEICKKVKADEYLSPPGAASYIEKNQPGGEFAKEGIRLYYHHYEHPQYKQVGKNFIPYMGIFDLLLNVGFHGALEIIRSGDRKNIDYTDFNRQTI